MESGTASRPFNGSAVGTGEGRFRNRSLTLTGNGAVAMMDNEWGRHEACGRAAAEEGGNQRKRRLGREDLQNPILGDGIL